MPDGAARARLLGAASLLALACGGCGGGGGGGCSTEVDVVWILAAGAPSEGAGEPLPEAAPLLEGPATDAEMRAFPFPCGGCDGGGTDGTKAVMVGTLPATFTQYSLAHFLIFP